MTRTGIIALRRAATVAHALPGVRLRLRLGAQTLLRVSRPPLPREPAISTCAFRMRVARAHHELRAGARLSFLGLPEGTAPAIDVGVRAGDTARPDGLYRIALDDDTAVTAFATTLPLRDCRRMLEADPGARAADIRLHHDAATDVTLVHTVEHRAAPASEIHPLDHLLPAFMVDELIHELVFVS